MWRLILRGLKHRLVYSYPHCLSPFFSSPGRVQREMDVCMDYMIWIKAETERERKEDDEVRHEGWCESTGTGSRWRREQRWKSEVWKKENPPLSGCCWAEFSFGRGVASKKDHAIKMTHSGDFGHGQGDVHFPAFITTQTARSTVSFSHPLPLYCPHFSHREFIRNWPSDKWGQLNLMDAEDNRNWASCESRWCEQICSEAVLTDDVGEPRPFTYF